MKLKKVFVHLLVCLLTFLCVACGEYTQPTSDKVVGGDSSSSTTTPPDGGEDDGYEENDEYFTVRLLLDGEPFTKAEGAVAQWSDGVSSHLAAINAEGVAQISGLDGEYHITLLYLDEDYAYNPNLYEANNDNTDISIDIYKIPATKGTGKTLYSCKDITKEGVYVAELKSAADVVYFEFSPSGSGSYIVETWVDITANNVNPNIEVYTGHSQAKYFYETLIGGGISSDYTQNVKHVLNLDELQRGHSFTFGIKARHRNGQYPVTVPFRIYREGDYEMDRHDPVWILPEEDFKQAPEGEGTWTWPETKQGSISVFDGSLYQYNEATGYYHVYDPATGEYGPMLYALITEPHRCFSPTPDGEAVSFYNLESVAMNSMLSYVADGTKNYKLFIEGYNHIIETDMYAPPQYSNVHGYGEYTNSDGAYPVTKELQLFLQEFATSQMYFQDGLGWAEINLNVFSTEEDQWLFACGYYK